MNKEQRKNLSARVLVDAVFREQFLKNPKKAAAKLGIELSDKEVEKVMATVDDIRKAAAKTQQQVDKIIAHQSVIPVIIVS